MSAVPDLVLRGGDRGLDDEDRELLIVNLGDLMLTAMRLWEETGDFMYRGDADRLMARRTSLIKSRPPEFVRRLEAARGLV